MKIKAYLKPSCGWSNGVRAIMRKHDLAYEDIDIINNRDNYAEMVAKSGQPLSPCVEIDGVMLADVSGEEVENYMLANDLIKPVDRASDSPTNAGCSDEEHARMATKTIRFFWSRSGSSRSGAASILVAILYGSLAGAVFVFWVCVGLTRPPKRPCADGPDFTPKIFCREHTRRSPLHCCSRRSSWSPRQTGSLRSVV